MSAYSACRLDAAFAALDGHFRALVAPPAPPPDRAHDDGGNGGGNNGGGNGKGAAPPAVPLATLIPKLIKLPAWVLPDPAGQPPAATPNGSAQQATAPNGGGPTGGGPGGGGATLGEASRSRSRRPYRCLPASARQDSRIPLSSLSSHPSSSRGALTLHNAVFPPPGWRIHAKTQPRAQITRADSRERTDRQRSRLVRHATFFTT